MRAIKLERQICPSFRLGDTRMQYLRLYGLEPQLAPLDVRAIVRVFIMACMARVDTEFIKPRQLAGCNHACVLSPILHQASPARP